MTQLREHSEKVDLRHSESKVWIPTPGPDDFRNLTGISCLHINF